MMKSAISKEARLLVNLHLSALILAFILVRTDNVSAGYNRNFSKGLKIAHEILSDQESINPYHVVELMVAMRKAMLDSVTTDITAPRLTRAERSNLVQVLGLARLTEISWENCLESDRIVSNGNYHQTNYLELNQFLNRVYQSKNMQQIIKQYFETQLFICRHALVAHFELKLKELRQKVSNFDKFVEVLNYSFPREVPIALLTRDHKVNGAIQLIKMFYPLKELEKTRRMHGTLAYHFMFYFKGDCSFNLLVPLKTLLMTYEHINRSDLSFTRKYFDIIRAYYLCNMLKQLTAEEEAALVAGFAQVSREAVYAAKMIYQDLQKSNKVPSQSIDTEDQQPATTSLAIPSHLVAPVGNPLYHEAGPSNVDQSVGQQQVTGNRNQDEDDEWLKLGL